MNDAVLKELLEKYHAGTLSAAEKAQLEQWYAAFDAPGGGPDPFPDDAAGAQAGERLLHRIQDSLAVARRQQCHLVRQLRRRMLYRAAAAVLLLALAGAPLYFWLRAGKTPQPIAETWQESVTAGGKMLKLTLGDGSRVWLNANTRLRYPAGFNGSRREIWLTEGEAFFDVAPGSKPFIVHTGRLAVQVLGTSFNVRAYTQLQQVSVGVATGKVQVSSTGKVLGQLLPGRQLSWDRSSGRFALSDAPAGHMGAWKEGLIRLDGASFAEMAVTIKNLYGYTLVTKNRTVEKASFNATFRSSSKIDDVMKMICRMQLARYQKKDSTVILY